MILSKKISNHHVRQFPHGLLSVYIPLNPYEGDIDANHKVFLRGVIPQFCSV